jgi:hypothetical protein
MPVFKPSLFAALAFLPAAAFATGYNYNAGKVDIQFDTDAFNFSIYDAEGFGSRDILPDSLTYSATSNGVMIDFGGQMNISDYAQNESDSQISVDSNLFASFSFAAHAGYKITGYQLAVTGSYDIESPGTVTASFSGFGAFSSNNSGFGQNLDQLYTYAGSSAPSLSGSFSAVGQLDFIEVQVGTEIVQVGTEWVPDPACTLDPSECPLIEQPVYAEVPVYMTQADLGLASLAPTRITLTAVTAPVPEAERYVLLLVGLGVLTLVARRRSALAVRLAAA